MQDLKVLLTMEYNTLIMENDLFLVRILIFKTKELAKKYGSS